MTDAAQVALALLADVGEEEQGEGQFDAGVDQGVSEGQQASQAGAVVAGAGGLDAVAVDDGDDFGSGGKDGVEVGGEDDQRSGVARRQMRCGKQGEDVAGLVGFDGAEASLGKAGGEPGGANLFAEGRGGNGDQLRPASP